MKIVEEKNVVVDEVIDEESYQILKQDLNKKDDFFTIEDLKFFLKNN